MTVLPKADWLRHVANTRVQPPETEYPSRHEEVLSLAAHARTREAISAWPGYRATPLISLPGLANACQLGAIWYKDEAGRFGLGSFKALGGAYAVLRLLLRRLAEHTGREAAPSDLADPRHADAVAGVTVCCATDGNHGRSVAWGAQRFGCACVIYVHATVSQARVAAIEGFGARVVRIDGNYDDAVRAAARDASTYGWFVVSDTSYEGYTDIPRDVMQGYSVMAQEVLEQLPEGDLPSHVFIQGGVGGLAAAITAHFWERLGHRRPRIIVVEPDRAACIFASIAAGERVAVPGDLDTLQAGLACGEVSLLAWDILKDGVSDVLAIPDKTAVACMRLLAGGVDGDPAIVAGESAVAGQAGVVLARQRPDLAQALGLDRDSRILVFGTEGATDEGLYARLLAPQAEGQP